MRRMKGGMRSEAITEQSDIKTGVAAEATRGGGSGLGRDGNATSTIRRAGKEEVGRKECVQMSKKKQLAGSLAETEGKRRALGGRGTSGGAGEEEEEEWREKMKREMRGDVVAAEAQSCKELRAAEED